VKKLIGFVVMAFMACALVVGTVGCGDHGTAKSTKTTDMKTTSDTKMETKTEDPKPK